MTERKIISPWRPPTRRAFIAMLTTAAAAFAIDERVRGVHLPDDDRPPSRWTGKTRWIGHC